MFEVDDLLGTQLRDEPTAEGAVVGFDFTLPLGGSGFDGVAVDAELGEALAEGVRLERRALIELEAIGQSLPLATAVSNTRSAAAMFAAKAMQAAST